MPSDRDALTTTKEDLLSLDQRPSSDTSATFYAANENEEKRFDCTTVTLRTSRQQRLLFSLKEQISANAAIM